MVIPQDHNLRWLAITTDIPQDHNRDGSSSPSTLLGIALPHHARISQGLRRWGRLPQEVDGIGSQLRIATDEGGAFLHAVRHEEPVKRVAMVPRKPLETLRFGEANGPSHEARLVGSLHEIIGHVEAAEGLEGMGASKSLDMETLPLHRPSRRLRAGPMAISRATGLPARASTISSPDSASSTKRESCVFATCTLTIFATRRS